MRSICANRVLLVHILDHGIVGIHEIGDCLIRLSLVLGGRNIDLNPWSGAHQIECHSGNYARDGIRSAVDRNAIDRERCIRSGRSSREIQTGLTADGDVIRGARTVTYNRERVNRSSH